MQSHDCSVLRCSSNCCVSKPWWKNKCFHGNGSVVMYNKLPWKRLLWQPRCRDHMKVSMATNPTTQGPCDWTPQFNSVASCVCVLPRGAANLFLKVRCCSAPEITVCWISNLQSMDYIPRVNCWELRNCIFLIALHSCSMTCCLHDNACIHIYIQNQE